MQLPFRAKFAGRYIEMRMRRVHLTMRTEGITAFSNRYGVVVWTGENDPKTISVDASLFENGAKQLRFRLKTDQCGQGLKFISYTWNRGATHNEHSPMKGTVPKRPNIC